MSDMVAFIIPGEPVPFARAGSNKGRRYTPSKQLAYMGVIKLFAQQAMAGEPPMEGPVGLSIRAVYLIPASWTKKEKAAAVWKSSKPDADNLAKIFKDAMSKIVFADDAQVADLQVQKVYGLRAEIIITVSPL